MIISDEKKFIFIAVPKTGSSSIEKALGKYHNDELPTGIVKHTRFSAIPELFKKPYYKFCFFRNPWDRMVSLYHHHVKVGDTIFDYKYDEIGFTEWINKIKLANLDELGRQTDYLLYKGKIAPNVAVYKFEEMDDAWNHICKTLDIEEELPHINKSKHKHYSTYYNDETRHFIKVREYGVIKMMGYEFEEMA